MISDVQCSRHAWQISIYIDVIPAHTPPPTFTGPPPHLPVYQPFLYPPFARKGHVLFTARACIYCRMANFSVWQSSLILHFQVFPFLIFPKRGHPFFPFIIFPFYVDLLVYQRENVTTSKYMSAAATAVAAKTTTSKHFIDWRQSPVLYKHVQGLAATHMAVGLSPV